MLRIVKHIIILATFMIFISCNAGAVTVEEEAGVMEPIVNPYGGFPAEMNAGQFSTDNQMSTGNTPVEEMMAGSIATEEEMAGNMPVEEMAGNMPVEEIMAGEVTAGDISEEMMAGEISQCNPEVSEACVQCDENGIASVPLEDERCPMIDCSVSERSIDLDGNCVEMTYLPAVAPLCYDLGECEAVEEQICELNETQVLATGGACQEIVTCESGVDLEFSQRPNGALCNGWGTCQDGECSAAAACAEFTPYNQRNRYCRSEETNQGETTCTFLVYGLGLNGNGEITCTEFCERSGAECVDGWNNDNDNNCRRGRGDDGCNESYSSQVCVCRAP